MRILIFAPHNDDEVLGVGGTIAKYVAEGNDVFLCEATSPLDNFQLVNMIREEAQRAHEVLGIKKSFFLELPVVSIKDTPTKKVNALFEHVVSEVKPEIAFIPNKGDIHIDHFEVSRAAMVALRPILNPQLKEIYSYETLSETEWNIPSVEYAFMPNCYNDITAYMDAKIMAMKCYESQLYPSPHPRSLDAITSLAKLRGSTIGVKYAESFMLIRKRM